MKTSKFREADNLVIRLAGMVNVDRVAGHEIFIFADNVVFKSCYYKGYSESEKLSDIIFDFTRRRGRDA